MEDNKRRMHPICGQQVGLDASLPQGLRASPAKTESLATHLMARMRLLVTTAREQDSVISGVMEQLLGYTVPWDVHEKEKSDSMRGLFAGIQELVDEVNGVLAHSRKK